MMKVKQKVCCAAMTLKLRETKSQLLPKLETCTVASNNRITYGHKAGLFDFPWLVRVGDVRKDFFCGGSLINERYVLTAAHCVIDLPVGTRTIVRLGEWNSETVDDCMYIDGVKICSPPVIDILVSKIHVHRGYNSSIYYENSVPRKNFRDDIALLRLSETVTYTESVKPICIPLESQLQGKEYPEKHKFIVTGWGVTEKNTTSNHKLYGRVPLMPLSDCKRLLKNVTPIDESQICAGGDGHDTCRGDSGGPLLDLHDFKYIYLAGLTSFGFTKCGVQGLPSVYTRVDKHLDWILWHLEE